MDDIAAEVRATFAAIMDAVPPIPLEVWNAFIAIGAAGLLLLVVSILNMWGKLFPEAGRRAKLKVTASRSRIRTPQRMQPQLQW
jgi:hypothetical protein